MIVDKFVRQNAVQREGEPVDKVNEGGKQRERIVSEPLKETNS